MKVALLLAALLVRSPLEIAVLPQLPASDVTDADVERLFAGVDQARGYNDLVAVLTRHERTLVSQRLLDSIDRQLRNASLNENQRGALLPAHHLGAARSLTSLCVHVVTRRFRIRPPSLDWRRQDVYSRT
jgi:hypothetical protein